MLKLGKRIRALREAQHLNQSELARRCGWDSPSRIGNYEQETREPKLADLEHISNALGLTLQKLMFGTDIDSPSNFGRVVEWEKQDKRAEEDYVVIHRYNLNLSAGCATIAWVIQEEDPLAFHSRFMQAKGYNPDNLKALYIRGDSMEPYLQDHDTVMIDISDTTPRDGVVYAVGYDDEWYIKRLFKVPGGGLLLQPDNPHYKEMEVKPERIDVVRIFGRVTWRGG